MSYKYVGETIGIFEIIERMSYKDNDGHALYKGVCIQCGFERVARINGFKDSKRCTHIRVDGQIATVQTNWNNPRIKDIFNGMKQRCYNTNDKNYCIYGARGIKICDEWMDNPKLFEDWSIQNGYFDDLVIYRIDKSKNYCPENCKWVTNEYSQKIKSTSNLIKINDIEDSGSGWSIRLGFGRNYINRFIKKHGLKKTIECILAKLDGDDDVFGPKKKKSVDEKNKDKKQRQRLPIVLCKICGKKIDAKNKSGMCNECYVQTRQAEKIQHWLETGDTGTAPAQHPPDIIRKYVFNKQDGKCAICGMKNEWNGKELKFIFDHIDGNAADSSVSNVRLICPNCDSQLDTFKSKNKNSARQFRHKYT